MAVIRERTMTRYGAVKLVLGSGGGKVIVEGSGWGRFGGGASGMAGV